MFKVDFIYGSEIYGFNHEIFEYDGRCTCKRFKSIINRMFQLACEGIDNSEINLYLGRIPHVITMITKIDGSVIDAYVYINSCFYRKMNIAS